MLRNRGILIISIAVFVASLILAESWVLSLESRLRGRILRIQVVIIIQALISIMSLYLWKNLSTLPQVKDQSNYATPPAWSQFVWKCVLLCYIILAHGSYISNALLVRTEPTFIALVCYFCLGLHVQMFTFLILMKVFNVILKVVRKGPVRKNTSALLTIIYALSMTTYGYYKINQPPIIKNVSIPIKDLGSSLDGFTITLLSDIHLGPTVGKKQLETAVHMSNNLESDVIVIVGDLVDGLVADLKDAVQPLQNLKSKHGVLYVTGNHEYYTMDVENWMNKLKELGITILHNANVKIPYDSNNHALCFVGTDDLEADRIKYEGHGMRLDTAIEGCSSSQTVILLAHQPKAAKNAIMSGHKIDLILSGHTHGGQMFPIIIGAYLFNPFYVGLYQQDKTHIYVTPGTYYWGFPMRILTQHEITKITLVSV